MSKSVETVSFKLTAGSDVSAFVAASDKVTDWARKQPGFLSRELAQLEDDSWLDIAYWTSTEAAKKAGETFMSELGDSAFMAMIDPASVKMTYGELHLSTQSG